MEYLCKSTGWNFAGLMCYKNYTYSDIGYDVTIATYLVPVLYFPKMENALIVGPEYNRLSFACALIVMSILIDTHGMNNKSK